MPQFPVQIKRSGTASSAPTSLLHGELAINYNVADGKLFWKDSSNVIQSFTFQSYALASHSHDSSGITSTGVTNGHVLTANGSGGASWQAPAGGAPSGAAGGDLTGTYPNPQIAAGAIVTADLANSAVTYAKIQNVSATDRLLGRSSAGAGVIEEVTCTSQGRSLIAGVDAAAQRTTLGLGAMATSSGITLTGDVTGSGTGSFATTLSNSGVSAGTYRSVTVDVKGRVTGGTNPTTLAGYGITDAPTTTGTGASGTWAISISGSAAQLGGVTAANYFRVDGTYANADMNTPVEGYWHVAPTATNLPDGALYGHRWDYDHAGDGNWVAQFYTPTSGDAGMWFRQRRGGTWQTWRKFLDSTTYNSYSPTLTGGGASGTWGINVTGTAASETLATVTGRGASTASNITTTGAVYSTNWFRSNGSSGWYNEAWGGGIYMTDATYIRIWGSKQFYADAAISSGTAMYAPIYYDANNGAYWVNPADGGFNLRGGSGNRVSYYTFDGGVIVYGAEGVNTSVRLGAAWGRPGIYNDTSIMVGAETQIDFVIGNSVKAYVDSSANLFANGSIRAPIFYDSQNTAYYCDPNGTSRMAGMDIDSLQVFGNHLYVGKSDTATYSYIHMRDSDEGERLLHCNSQRVGFLSQAGAWSAWSYDNGTWGCYGAGELAIEAIGGWSRYGCTIEVRTDSNGAGTQDGPRVWYHKGGAKWWAAGIQPYGSHGYAIYEDGGSTQWGTERLAIAVGGTMRHNNCPAYFVRAWAYFQNSSVYGSGNVSSISSRSATGKYKVNFTESIPGNPCCLGNVGNETDTFTNTTMRMGVRSYASGRMTGQDINIVTSGGQGVPAASDAMIGCSFLAIS